MVTIIERAPAKINLGLDIQGKRSDGYHDLSMVMVSIDLCDYVTVDHLDEDRIVFSSNCPKMPTNHNNDVYKAAQLMKDRFQIKTGVSLFLEKRIPVCAGMGGGSSDAAATIRALNQLWHLDLSQKDMIEIGMQIGSDVPYCLVAGCAQVTGKGEVVSQLAGQLSSWVVLVNQNLAFRHAQYFRILIVTPFQECLLLIWLLRLKRVTIMAYWLKWAILWKIFPLPSVPLFKK
ncbi:4-diphosphocytidyl-2-C-methyl-D-erythritolkinase [Streptococcus dysgalactiae subsp. equisimilis RE378]|nr:4-diphosphocytidyl-2-C-methyl-D-erythritolkinase [Streptococcus dysgalactiae subsp. equisimilis RE378]